MQLNVLPNWWWQLLIFATAAGGVGMALLGRQMKRRPGYSAVEKTFISRQIATICRSCVGAAGLLSFLGPITGIVPGPQVPRIWGFAYAQMALGVGAVYSREYLASAAIIFAGCIAAMSFPEFNGLILGPCMGLGMIVPGVISMRRVRTAMAEGGSGDDA